MCDSYIKSTRYHADSLFSKYYAPALKIEMPEVNSVSMSNAEHIEHTFCPKTCLSLASTYKWICHLRHNDKQSPSFQMTYDTTFCQDINFNPGRVTPCTIYEASAASSGSRRYVMLALWQRIRTTFSTLKDHICILRENCILLYWRFWHRHRQNSAGSGLSSLRFIG